MDLSFGELVRSLRKANDDMTLKELADAADMTFVEISNIEKGKHKPRPSTIRKLATALNYSYSELYDASQKK